MNHIFFLSPALLHITLPLPPSLSVSDYRGCTSYWLPLCLCCIVTIRPFSMPVKLPAPGQFLIAMKLNYLKLSSNKCLQLCPCFSSLYAVWNLHWFRERSNIKLFPIVRRWSVCWIQRTLNMMPSKYTLHNCLMFLSCVASMKFYNILKFHFQLSHSLFSLNKS